MCVLYNIEGNLEKIPFRNCLIKLSGITVDHIAWNDDCKETFVEII